MKSHLSALKRYKPLTKYVMMFLDVQIGVLICSFVANAMGLLSPYLTKLIFDFAYPSRDWPLLVILASLALLLTLFSTATGALQQYVQLYASQNLTFSLRSGFLRHLYRLPLSFFQTRSAGEHLYRLSADIDGTASFLGGIVPNLLNPVVSLVLPLCAVLWMDWRFAIAALCALPCFAIQATYFGRRQRALAREIAAQAQEISSQTTDRIYQLKLIKSFGREQRELRFYLSNQIKLIRLAFRRYWLNLKYTTLSSSFNSIAQAGLALYMGYRLVRGDISVGTLVALSMYFTQLLGAAKGLAGLYQSVINQLVPVERILDILEQNETIVDKPGSLKIEKVEGAVSFHDVQFAYKQGNDVLDGLSMVILPGQMVAVVGASGAGKTTILGLLLRLYDPQRGKVCLDGHDIRDLRLSSLRSHIGIALQESLLFNTTISENIRYGYPSASKDDITEAAKLADAHEFIEQLPHAYDTKVGENGCNLSMGQRQRIGIARALVKRPRIVVLDEATASLSSTSEATVLDALRPRASERTLIIITHRLTAIREADRIFVLDGKRIVESGTHELLLSMGGLYRTLWDCQSGMSIKMRETIPMSRQYNG